MLACKQKENCQGMEEPATTVFVPCGHMAACRTCGERLQLRHRQLIEGNVAAKHAKAFPRSHVPFAERKLSPELRNRRTYASFEFEKFLMGFAGNLPFATL